MQEVVEVQQSEDRLSKYRAQYADKLSAELEVQRVADLCVHMGHSLHVGCCCFGACTCGRLED